MFFRCLFLYLLSICLSLSTLSLSLFSLTLFSLSVYPFFSDISPFISFSFYLDLSLLRLSPLFPLSVMVFTDCPTLVLSPVPLSLSVLSLSLSLSVLSLSLWQHATHALPGYHGGKCGWRDEGKEGGEVKENVREGQQLEEEGGEIEGGEKEAEARNDKGERDAGGERCRRREGERSPVNV